MGRPAPRHPPKSGSALRYDRIRREATEALAAQARLMAEQTFLGASELLNASDADPAELRRRVTSPNGTTERAIQQLEAADLTALFDRAAAAAVTRAQEMARGE